MRQYMIDKYARKMRDRERNRLVHENSPRHTFNPTSLDCLKEKRDAIYQSVSETFKRDECIRILKNYKLRGSYSSYSVLELELAIANTILIKRCKGKDIELAKAHARDVASHRFSPHRLRRHYHRIHAGEHGYWKGNEEYDSYEYILSTWYTVYGQRWDGEPYHIDHIKPLRTARDIAEVKRLNKLPNLCMISTHDNLSKGGMFPHPIYYILRTVK